MKNIFAAAAAFALVGATSRTQALAQGQSEMTLPSSSTTFVAPLRVIPVIGASSFTTSNKVDIGRFDQGFTAGAYADWGVGSLNLEVGVLSLNSRELNNGAGSRTFTVDNWGIPILAKYHFGNPHHSIFVKAGAMPFTSSGGANEFNVMGVAGVGAHIPLGTSTSILLEGSYDRLLTSSGSLGDYQGVSLLGGLAFNI